ncbi:MAG: acetyl-CoA carboxylase biotin carboxyl carrier protein [Bacteroidia bacterium]
MKTDLNYIKKLIKIIDTCDVNEIEIEEEGTRLKVVKNRPVQHEIPQFIQYTPQPVLGGQLPQAIPTNETAEKAESPATSGEKKPEKANLIEVRSPIVGTFYRAPSPTADPYVQVGQQIKVGTILCIIEAMKLMNEIESEVDGKISKILVENGKPVEYNQVLFLVEPA